MQQTERLDRYLPESVRHFIEQRYYARINEQARLENALHDPHFLHSPFKHIVLYSDHGVVHVRDVAYQVLHVLDVINGILIPERNRNRLDFFMKGYGVIMAYLHDIGMIDFSQFGRKMHPEFASQEVFATNFDAILNTIWDETSGNIAWRLLNLSNSGVLPQKPHLVLREMLTMANCHSKSKVPIDILNDRHLLQNAMRYTLSTDLHVQYREERLAHARTDLLKGAVTMDAVSTAEANLDVARAESWNERFETWIAPHYDDFFAESFQWLVSEHPAAIELAEDVIDTLRALRCAEALRQRGTVLETSGNYQVFVDRITANAIYALYRDDQMFLLEVPDPSSAGEANVASSELDQECNVRISFHRGSFPDAKTVQRAAQYAAFIVDDIQGDVIGSFYRPSVTGCQKRAQDMHILLEDVDDNLMFADIVRDELITIRPELRLHIRIVPSLKHASTRERQLYLQAPDCEVDPNMPDRMEVLRRVGESGHKVDKIDPEQCFKHVRLITLRAGDTLIEAGSLANFAYIPMGDGLRVLPMGGYQPLLLPGWAPLGNAGIIRGDVRNATVVADHDVRLLMIPKEVYLRFWHCTYSPEELIHTLTAENVEEPL